MKATELMIGDWFKTTYPNNRVEYRKVTSIYENGYVGCKDCVTNAIEPILITKEILEKNGFEKYSSDEYIIVEDVVWYAGALYVYADAKILFDTMECEYVHQLQHILRLCRIDKTIEP